jgi:hypothetical protein
MQEFVHGSEQSRLDYGMYVYVCIYVCNMYVYMYI